MARKRKTTLKENDRLGKRRHPMKALAISFHSQYRKSNRVDIEIRARFRKVWQAHQGFWVVLEPEINPDETTTYLRAFGTGLDHIVVIEFEFDPEKQGEQIQGLLVHHKWDELKKLCASG